MQMIAEKAMEMLRKAGISEVYPAFDAIPLPSKSDRRFTVVGLESVQMDAPFPDGGRGVHPFTATLKISVLVPMNTPGADVAAYYFETLLPVLLQLGAVPGETALPVVDVKLQRLVMSGLLRIRGLYTEWDEEIPDENMPEEDAPEELV